MRRVFLAICLLYILTEVSAWRRRRRRTSPPPCSAVNCRVGSWTSWSSCSHQCGTSGTQTRTRQQIQAASCGGTCPYNTYESQACNRDNCRNGGTPHSSGCSCRTGYGGTCCEQGRSRLRSVCMRTSRNAITNYYNVTKLTESIDLLLVIQYPIVSELFSSSSASV